MNTKDLDLWSFYWSEARLVVAAAALVLGGIPPIFYLVSAVPVLYGVVALVLKIAWFISGGVSVYLLYRWVRNSYMVFGRSDNFEIAAFLVSVVSGLNLGVAGLLGANIGMSISSNYLLFLITAAVYLVSAGYLWSRWSAYGRKLF